MGDPTMICVQVAPEVRDELIRLRTQIARYEMALFAIQNCALSGDRIDLIGIAVQTLREGGHGASVRSDVPGISVATGVARDV
jgi:hypothetical protein